MAKKDDESNPSKKTKLEIATPTSKLKTSTGELSLEFSDDEEKNDLVGKKLETIKVYKCKHCQFYATDLMHLVSHYEDSHPFISCNSVYIEEKSDQSAMFRCLQCPVEFSVEAHLHAHYSKDHPNSPEIFSLKFADLVHKCFLCSFTSKILQSLKEHYKEKHPSEKVENPLWFCKYLSAQHDGYSTHRHISEAYKSPEKHETERTTTASLDEATTSIPKSHDGTMYYCGKCLFSHKSVVVLHVHYKKCHPDEPITLDKIKLLNIPLPVAALEVKPGLEQDISHPFEMENSVSPDSDPENKDKSVSQAVFNISPSPEPVERRFFCLYCNFSNPNVKSVIGHHNAKHKTATTTEEIIRYTLAREKKKNVVSVHNPRGYTLVSPQDLFYCKVCHYGNPALVGIMNHQIKIHGFSEGKSDIQKYTTKIHDEIKKSQIHQNSSILPSGLPLPLIDGDTTLIFCQLCNYRHKDLSTVSRHFQKSHRGFRRKTQEIVEYTSMVYERLNKSPQSKRIEQKETFLEPAVESKLQCVKCPYRTPYVHLMRKHLQSLHKSTWICSNIVELCATAGATFEPGYLCDSCTFCHEDLEVVKRHSLDKHGRYISDQFLNRCMYLSPELCDSIEKGAFNNTTSDTKKQDSSDDDEDDDDAPVVEEEAPFDSYQMPLEFDNLNVTTQETKDFSCSYCSAKFEEQGGLWIHMGMKHRDEIEERPQLEMDSRTQAFKCNSCSYVNNLKQGVATHIIMKHPSKTLKMISINVEREHLKNVQLKMKMGMWKFCGFRCRDCFQVYPSKNRLKLHRKTHKQCTGGSKNSIYTCALCPDSFITLVRLRIHYTKKHGKAASLKYCGPMCDPPPQEVKAAHFQHIPKEERMVLMYKCPSCRYVNSSPHGTLTHCQMRHPKLEVRAGKLKTLEIDLVNMIGCQTERQNTYGGYRCRKCPKIYSGQAKLKIHCVRDHYSKGTTEVQTLAPESGTSDQKKLFSKFRHFFKCSVCSFSTSILKQLGNHYMQRHGKSSYIKFYSPLLHQINKPKMPFKHEETGQTKNPVAQAESKLKTSIPLQAYKCSVCPYGTPYRRYLIAHFKNRHKYDSQTVYKHMEKYKKYKPTPASGQLTCKTCQDVCESTGGLLAHYQTIHSSDMHMDFIITAKRTERSTGVYTCNYCKNKIYGIKNLCKHLDRHRARLKKKKLFRSKVSEQSTPNPIEETVERSEVPPAFSSQSFGEAEVSEEQCNASLTCLRCKRSFKSLKGLLSHKRSHAAVAALGNVTTLDFQEHINQCIAYRPGTTRPFTCTLCPYRTTVISLSKNHIRRKHPQALNSAEVGKDLKMTTQKDNEAPRNCVDGMRYGDDDEPENSFLEAPDVQRQLKHYNVMAQILPAEKTQNILLNEPRMFPCEMCNFKSQHYSNMRRHYVRRHGKKMMRCKYCDFFTCFKKNMDLHEQMGHSTVQSEPTHNKNLCCPFCFYQSKNKNNMIDHIVLHREERVLPIEVRRSKLSRYLQGIVFRCYKCTFTCGSADSLDSHMAKHNDLKPFKCRLCFFDCVQLRELEEHLCDKHQVVRNHQLVGQVCLDQVEAREDKNPQDDDDDDDDNDDDDEEMPCDPETEEQTVNNEKNQHNKNQAAGAEQNHRNPESPKMQHVARRSLDPRFNNLAKYINGEKNFKQKPVEDKSESSPVCMNEERDETQDNPQNAPLRTTPGNASSAKIPTIHEEVLQDQHKKNSTADETFYGEMPILEKYFKEQCLVYAHSGEASSKPPCSSIMDLPPVLQSDGDVVFPSPAAVDTFPCDYCGRNFTNPSELERHMLRHRM